MLTVTMLLALASLAGDYRCSGTATDGKPYSGLSLAVEALDDTYLLSWSDNGRKTQAGYGFVDGDRLVAVMVNVGRPGLGVVSYKVSGGTLTGVWSGGDGHIYTERCVLRGTRNARLER